MKRTIKFVFLLFIIILTGCFSKNEITTTNKLTTTTTNSTTTSTNVNNSTTTTTAEVKDLVTQYTNLTVKDIATAYNIEGTSLPVYKYEYDPNIDYVNVSEFVDFMQGGITDLDISKTDVLTLSFTLDVPEEYQEIYGGPTYTYEMTLNADKDEIYLNDFNMLDSMNGTSLIQYDTDLSVSNFDIEGGNPSVTIDLSKYDMNIVKSNDNYYIPMYLANLFLTGSSINVYEMNHNLIIFDTFSDVSNLYQYFKNPSTFNFNNIKTATQNYLALYFDYFYGLKNYKNVDSYQDVLEGYHFNSANSIDDINKDLEHFIHDLNDLHTSLISAGYLDKNFQYESNLSPKAIDYNYAYDRNQCLYRNSEIDTDSFDHVFVIHINQFTLNTREKLKPVMELAKNYDDVVLDLSCNPGGNVISVFELLSYLTNQDIPLTMVNPVTGEKTTEYYTTSNTEKLDANFYVLTSAATYSAANLFTSIVKDYHLGLVIGEKTGGGAATITYSVLPDGAIIVNSSDNLLTNKNGTIIEDGIPVDFNCTTQFNDDSMSNKYIYDLFTTHSSITINKSTTKDSIIYHADMTSSLILSDLSYHVSVYDTNTNELISDQEFTTNQFDYTIHKITDERVYRIEITVNYKYKDIFRHENLYQDTIDDHSNTVNPNVTELPIGQSISAYAYGLNDSDVFKFTTTNNGIYRIELNGPTGLYNQTLYDEDGNLIKYDNDFNLTPGTYYIAIKSRQTGNYTVKIHQLIDDNPDPTIINLQSGQQQNQINYDYVYDSESYQINVPSDSIVTLSWSLDGDSNYQYNIKNNDGTLLVINNLNTSHEETIFLEAGTYHIELITDTYIGLVNLTTHTTTNVYDDYSGDTSMNNTNYGPLNLGTNTINYSEKFDKDVYYIDITQTGKYYFTYNLDDGIIDYLDTDGTIIQLEPDYFINLSPGRYYFDFIGNKAGSFDYNLKLDIDDNNQSNIGTINLDQVIPATLSDFSDIDYYQFTTNETNTYQLDISGYTNVSLIISDIFGHQVAEQIDDSLDFTVTKGTYIIKIKKESEDGKIDTLNIKITDPNITDDALNTIYSAIQDYQVLEMGDENKIIGTKDYMRDTDMYIINISTAGNYQFHINNCDYTSLIYNNSNIALMNEKIVYLHTGTYFFKVSNINPLDDNKYTISFDKSDT